MYKKYAVNEDFFKKNKLNEDSAYVLGWLASDGCIQLIPNKKYCIRFDLKDIEILELIRKLMDSDHPIRTMKNRSTHLLTIDSKKLVKQLLDLGITPNKTHTLKMPIFENEELYSHFIRGCFDGDGSVRINHKKNNVKQLTSYICSVNKNFLKDIGEIIKENTGNTIKVHEDTKSFYKLSYGAKESFALYKYMYDNTSNFLSRKKSMFEEAIEIKAGTGLMNCSICKKEIIRTSGRVKYCKDCLREVRREQDRKRRPIKPKEVLSD